MPKKNGANEEGENEGEAHTVTAIPIQPNKNTLKLLIYIDLNHETLTKTQNTTPTKREMMRRENESLAFK